jgi:hypothetical protein
MISRLGGGQEESIKLGSSDDGDVTFRGYRSIFSRYNLYSHGPGIKNEGPKGWDESNWGEARRTDFKNPSTRLLCSNDLDLGAVEYDYSDFAYCADFGYIPNHWMITLRRFGSPVGDNIWSNKSFGGSPDVARAIGYMTDEKNKMEDILGFSVKMKFKELTSEIQTINQSNNEHFGHKLPGKGLAKVLDSTGSQANQALAGDKALNFDPIESYPNRVYGPIDVIDRINVRDRGLESTQSFELTFEYELKSIDGVNPRAAMLDLFTNLLLLTYNKGEFWGGATRFIGRKPPKFIGDPSQLQNGDFVGYAKSMLTDALGSFDNLTGGKGLSVDGIVNAAKTIGSNAMGLLGGKALDEMGRPDIIAIHSLLKGDEIGEWHLTVGNPYYPIMVIGNLILEDSKFAFSGPLGVDGFPSKLTLTCSLKPAMSRDRVGIQQMFQYGNGILKSATVQQQATSYYQNYSLSGGNGGKNQKNLVDLNIQSAKDVSNRFGSQFNAQSIEDKTRYNT